MLRGGAIYATLCFIMFYNCVIPGRLEYKKQFCIHNFLKQKKQVNASSLQTELAALEYRNVLLVDWNGEL